MQQTENQLGQDQTPANAHEDAHTQAALEANYKKAQLALSLALGADGAEKGSLEQALNVARMLEVRPELRSEVIAMLHQDPDLGNSFVQMVLHPEHQAARTASKNKDGQAPRNKSSKDAAAREPEAAKPQMEAATQAVPPAPAPAPEVAKPQTEAATQSVLPPPPPGGYRAPMTLGGGHKEQADAILANAFEPGDREKYAAKGAAGGATNAAEQVAETKSPQAVPAPPANEAAPKPEDKSEIEKSKDEKPEDKQGMVKITASALRIRDAGNLKGKVIGKIPRGGKAEVIGRQDVWLHVKFGGLTGFIHSKYTTSLKGNESGAEEEAHQGEGESHEQKQERPKAPPMVNDEQNQGVLV